MKTKEGNQCADVTQVGPPDRRIRQDRRANNVRAFFFQFGKPRRKRDGRRDGDTQGYYVDFHEPMLLLVVLVTLSLCIVDIYATLSLLEQGGVELNPVMRELIETDIWVFFIFKYVVTAGCLFILVSYKKFRLYKNFSALHTLYGVLLIYFLLVIYEIKLMALTLG